MRGAIIVALFLAGCVPTEFDDLRGEAQTRDLFPPDDYANVGFGSVVAGYGGIVDGALVSRAVGNAGRDTAYLVYPVLDGEDVRLDVATLDGCDDRAPCDAGAGGVLFGMPSWDGHRACVGVPQPGAGTIQLRCEDDPLRSTTISGPSGERFGEAVAALTEDHPFGRAIVGAPGMGRVYRLPDGGAPILLDLSAAAGVGDELGRAVAVAVVDADTVLIAAAAPVGSQKRVVVATVDVAGDGTATASVRGCLDAPQAGWGAALAVGDVDGDGNPDVVVGSAEDDGRLNRIRVYDGAAMGAPGTCDASWTHAVELECPAVEGVSCTAATFGSVLAVGDLDGDGAWEILAGEPDAEVERTAGAGAVFVFEGGDLAGLGGRVHALTHSSPEGNDHLGAAVGVAPGIDGRSEPVVGAPGRDRVYVFLCSELEAGQESFCQPR